MFKKYFALIFIFLISVTANAKSNIAIIDIEAILAQSIAAKSAAEQIKEKMDQYQGEIDKKSNLLKSEQNDLIKQSEILTQEALEAKQRDFMAKIKRLEGEVAQKKKNLDQLYVAAISKIENNIKLIIAEISQEKNYNLILAKNEIIYAQEIDDLTKEIVEILNQRLTKIELTNS